MNRDFMDIDRTNSIFFPHFDECQQNVRNKNYKFVQYTSAESALNIINGKEMWLRNTQCMNDYSEIAHGISCLIEAYNSDIGKRFKETINSISPEVLVKLERDFDDWTPSFRLATYITCVSEHTPDEQQYGRLSMWRAYGGDVPVALVLNVEPFFSDSDYIFAYTHPVRYMDKTQFMDSFSQLTDRIEKEMDYLKSIDHEVLFNYLFMTFQDIALCLKHPAFKEEREWRVVYSPNMRRSPHISSQVVSIGGLTQTVHKLPLKNIEEIKYTGVSIPELLHEVIIGPCDHPTIVHSAFQKVLEEEGCVNVMKRIKYSGVPLRR